MLLEKAHLAHAFRGNPAGSDIGDRSSGKFQPRMSDVHFFREHGDPDGLDFDHRFIDHRQQNVQVVNH